ncbi:hypothetical protein GCM10010442_78050 [Kitasatospora kifunensis]|uniref:Uncharacterized protein n=1 Tax=Kitasatospora kifunensis TaxID=58351 RepID=A0A7W7VZV5_KITKI|nr:hypothetical protein [Kitasatospora kifunensis]
MECRDSDSHRCLGPGKPPILPIPTDRDRRQHKAGKPDGPWWHIRQLVRSSPIGHLSWWCADGAFPSAQPIRPYLIHTAVTVSNPESMST